MDFPLKTIPLAKPISQDPKCNISHILSKHTSYEKSIH
jgi:hypothetical protein